MVAYLLLTSDELLLSQHLLVGGGCSCDMNVNCLFLIYYRHPREDEGLPTGWTKLAHTIV